MQCLGKPCRQLEKGRVGLGDLHLVLRDTDSRLRCRSVRPGVVAKEVGHEERDLPQA